MPDLTELQRAIAPHYDAGLEAERLQRGPRGLELLRTLDLIARHAPAPPAVVVDVGGGPGVYAVELAEQGYTVHLVDLMPLHVQQARALAAERGVSLASAEVGDARQVALPDACADLVLLLGPLYHLQRAEDRAHALRQAHRLLRPDGVLLAAAISRFASTLDGIRAGLLRHADFRAIAARDRATGCHDNPDNVAEYFTTAFFHHPDELADEVRAAGFACEAVVGVEGPAWLAPEAELLLAEPATRDLLLAELRAVEAEPSLVGASAHLLAVGRACPAPDSSSGPRG